MDKRVWIVKDITVCGEGDDVVALFDNKEAAEEWLKKANDDHVELMRRSYPSYRVVPDEHLPGYWKPYYLAGDWGLRSTSSIITSD